MGAIVRHRKIAGTQLGDIGRDPSRLILGEQVDPEALGELCSLSG
jgi:hypothetical protein